MVYLLYLVMAIVGALVGIALGFLVPFFFALQVDDGAGGGGAVIMLVFYTVPAGVVAGGLTGIFLAFLLSKIQ